MKKVVRLVLAALLLVGAVSTASFADGGAPAPMCSPSHCPPRESDLSGCLLFLADIACGPAGFCVACRCGP